MKLERTVIFEKKITFWDYNNPKKVPAFLWYNAYELMNQDRMQVKEIYEIYIDVVLTPLLKMEQYEIEGPFIEQYTGEDCIVVFNDNNSFRFSVKQLLDIRANSGGIQNFTISYLQYYFGREYKSICN